VTGSRAVAVSGSNLKRRREKEGERRGKSRGSQDDRVELGWQLKSKSLGARHANDTFKEDTRGEYAHNEDSNYHSYICFIKIDCCFNHPELDIATSY
jgi:hypothetical protein